MENYAATLPLPATAPRRRRSSLVGFLALWVFLYHAVQDLYDKVSTWIPVLLVVDILLQTYAVLGFLTSVLGYASRDTSLYDHQSAAHRPTAICLLVLFVAVLLLLCASLVSMWIESWLIYHRGFRAPSGAKFGLKPVMQAVRSEELSLRNINAGNRPSLSLFCQCRQTASGDSGHLDRMHPATATSGRVLGCLPFYDHWCFWLWVPVCLTTVKSYLLSMVYILVFHTVSAGILGWSFAVWGFQSKGYSFVAVAAVLPAVINWVYTAPIVGKWQHLAFRNSPFQEWDAFVRPRAGRLSRFPMCVRASDGTYYHCLVARNPWDLGTIGNVRQVLGESFWMWPLPFLLPQAVRNYGRGDDSDLPFSESWLEEVRVLQATPGDVELAQLPARRRHFRSSSG